MELRPGTYTFGPSGGKLFVQTGRAGAAFLVGKHFTIEVTDWEGKLEVGEDPSQTRVELTADGGSLKVTDGDGGPVTLTDLDKKSLSKTINEQVLEGAEIKFQSDTARPSDDGNCIYVAGELQVFDEKTSLEFRLTVEQEDEEEEDGEDEDDEDDEDDEETGSEAEGDEAQSQNEGKHEAEARAGDDSEGSGEEKSGPDSGSEEDESAQEGEDEGGADDESSDPADREQRISGRAVFKQTEVGLEPHSTLLGLLRVRDEVEVTFEGTLDPEERG